MTAGGEADKVDKAKKILLNGGIGLAIILMSWTITTFIISALLEYFQTGSYGNQESHVVRIGSRNYRLIFKKLRGPIWESYIEGKVRLVTRLENDKHFLVFAGNHDQVKQFLKEN